MLRTRFSLLAMGAAILIAAASMAAPSDAPPLRSAMPAGLLERVTSELVLIETYVSDSSGSPLRGLGAEDFVLQVDGRREPIASFELRETPEGPGFVRSPEPSAAAPPPGPGQAPPRRFVLFFEDGTSAPQGLLAARKAAQEFLASGRAGDQIALAACDRRLRILHDFTTDREALRRTIEESLQDSRRFSDFASEQEAHQEEFQRTLATRNLKLARAMATNFANEEAPRLVDVLKGLRSLVDSLSTWRGYKAIIFMGDGIPEYPAATYLEQLSRLRDPDPLDAGQRLSLSRDIKDLAEAAAASGVTLHTIQTAGLTTGRAGEERSMYRRQNTLETLALNTGGTVSTSNDLARGLSQAEESSRSYYIIGYAPAGPPDGRYHTVQVRCRKSGAHVRWRRGFTRLLPAEAYSRTVQAAYLLPELYPDLGLEMLAVEGPGDASGRVTDLVLHLPVDRMLFIPVEGRPTASFEVGLVSLDDSLHETLRIARSLRLALEPDGGGKRPTGINLYARVHLPPRSQSISATVADRTAGTVGGARLALPSEGKSPGGIFGLSIYSLSEESAWIEVRKDSGPGDVSAPAEFTLGPALRRTFTEGEPLACGFRVTDAGESGSSTLQVAIRRGSAVLKTVGVDPIAPGHATKVGLPVDGLPEGDYEVAVQEVIAGRAADRATVPLRITGKETGGL
jgi:VWFA-related protein